MDMDTIEERSMEYENSKENSPNMAGLKYPNRAAKKIKSGFKKRKCSGGITTTTGSKTTSKK